jgi:hypothetical protein
MTFIAGVVVGVLLSIAIVVGWFLYMYFKG